MRPHRFGYAALIGPPNAGKSTLLNALLGQKLAIVSPKPQTTRNQITGILTREDAQIVLLDTPGVHKQGGSRLNRRLVEAAWSALHQAQAIVVVLDAALYAHKPQIMEKDLKLLGPPVERSGLPVIPVLNKTDAVKDKKSLLPVMARLAQMWPDGQPVPVSALRGQGLEDLLAVLLEYLPQGPALFPEDQLSTAPMRFLAAEIIREKLFLALSQELPYNTAVVVEDWKETQAGARISAMIYVARASHKGMVIGKGGQLLKDIGTKARTEIMEMTGQPVHLDLWVKVREGWTEDEGFMAGLDQEQGV